MRDYGYEYYCNGEGFDTYEDAAYYADVLFAQFNIYKCVFTKDEIKYQVRELVSE